MESKNDSCLKKNIKFSVNGGCLCQCLRGRRERKRERGERQTVIKKYVYDEINFTRILIKVLIYFMFDRIKFLSTLC